MNFQAVLLQPHKKSSTKRLREVLNSVFRHLDQVAAASVLDVGIKSRNSWVSARRSAPDAGGTAQDPKPPVRRATFHKCGSVTRGCVRVRGGGGGGLHCAEQEMLSGPPRKLEDGTASWLLRLERRCVFFHRRPWRSRACSSAATTTSPTSTSTSTSACSTRSRGRHATFPCAGTATASFPWPEILWDLDL